MTPSQVAPPRAAAGAKKTPVKSPSKADEDDLIDYLLDDDNFA